MKRWTNWWILVHRQWIAWRFNVLTIHWCKILSIYCNTLFHLVDCPTCDMCLYSQTWLSILQQYCLNICNEPWPWLGVPVAAAMGNVMSMAPRPAVVEWTCIHMIYKNIIYIYIKIDTRVTTTYTNPEKTRCKYALTNWYSTSSLLIVGCSTLAEEGNFHDLRLAPRLANSATAGEGAGLCLTCQGSITCGKGQRISKAHRLKFVLILTYNYCALAWVDFNSKQEWPIQMAIGYTCNVAFFKWKEPNKAAITSPHRTCEIIALRALQLTRFPRDFTAARRTVQGNTENTWRQRCNKTSTAFWKLMPVKPSSIVQAPTLKQRFFSMFIHQNDLRMRTAQIYKIMPMPQRKDLPAVDELVSE